ncbi:DUF1624 domain-containing protein [Leucobacter zeae]|nr:DUF1624 domain-containing protein [Leucobacter zeae]
MSSPLQRLRGFGLPPRIVGLDVARGIAVLGMVAAHTAELPGVLIWNDPATWIELVNGRSSMLFGVLAGVSIALMTGRGVVPEGPRLARMRLRLVARGIVIFAIGIALELLGTTIAVILTFYGAVYAVAILFVGMRVRTLLIWAACLALAGPALSSTLLALGVSTWGGGVGFVLGGAYSIVAWTALMLVGLVLGRLDITRRRTAALGLAVGVALSAVGIHRGRDMGVAAARHRAALLERRVERRRLLHRRVHGRHRPRRAGGPRGEGVRGLRRRLPALLPRGRERSGERG